MTSPIAQHEHHQATQDGTPRHALVTGGSSGIGLATCHALMAAGWQVVNFDIQPPPDGSSGAFVRVDMGDKAALAAALAEATAQRAFTGLVNNVAAIRPAPIEDTSLDDFDLQMAVTTRAALQCTQAVLPAMRAAGHGRIVNITSRAALGKELRSGYSAAKGALNALTRTWALELAAQGITVNAVAPGPIATAAFKAANPADSPRTQRIAQGIPVQRFGEPAEVAHAVGCFMHPMASFMTGQVLYVCGGITVGLAG
ncbi:SDR family oxidoreductase [Variovorax sp. J22G73]|uniref:SDR family oxidoreductase n=1 Tax=unclassified Variovorax TaxID=663243 RepID=UPI0025759A0C|nr:MULTISPECIES: SDR family oxidoreductase [unclassified Variovorax]MDM0005425.1 SDR family oxidoreductase [Variovorax sp. J22R203]MDM0098841.1 SDR family oxidoreductase [Variovorax sp. J22G73]